MGGRGARRGKGENGTGEQGEGRRGPTNLQEGEDEGPGCCAGLGVSPGAQAMRTSRIPRASARMGAAMWVMAELRCAII